MTNSPVPEWIKVVNLPIKADERGSLVIAQSDDNVPFLIKRAFYIFGVQENGSRGFHAHKANRQLLICIQGSSLIKMDNGTEKTEILLNEPNKALLVEPQVWHSMEEFSKDLIMLVLASDKYDENDYIRDYQQFLEYIKQK